MKKIEIVFGVILLIILGKLFSSEAYSFVVMAVAIVTCLVWLLGNSEIRRALFIGYSIRLLVGFIAYFDIYPIEGSRSDAVFFLEEAAKIYAPTLSQIWKNYMANSLDFFPVVIAWVYFIFGKSAFLMAFINIILSTLVIRNVYLFTKQIHSAKHAKVAAWIMCFLPYSIMFGVTVTREPLITFLFTYCFVILAKDKMAPKSYVLLLVLLASLILIHGAFLFFAVAVMIYFVVAVFIKSQSIGQRLAILVLAGMILISGYFIVLNFAVSKLGFLNPEASGEVLTEALFNNVGSSIDESNYRGEVEVTGVLGLFTNFGTVVVPFFLQPYLWRLIELKSYFLLFLGSIPWHIILLLSAIYFRLFLKVIKSNLKHVLIIGSLGIVFAYGSSQINQAIRHNHKMIPIVIGLLCPVIVRDKFAAKLLSFED